MPSKGGASCYYANWHSGASIYDIFRDIAKAFTYCRGVKEAVVVSIMPSQTKANRKIGIRCLLARREEAGALR